MVSKMSSNLCIMTVVCGAANLQKAFPLFDHVTVAEAKAAGLDQIRQHLRTLWVDSDIPQTELELWCTDFYPSVPDGTPLHDLNGSPRMVAYLAFPPGEKITKKASDSLINEPQTPKSGRAPGSYTDPVVISQRVEDLEPAVGELMKETSELKKDTADLEQETIELMKGTAELMKEAAELRRGHRQLRKGYRQLKQRLAEVRRAISGEEAVIDKIRLRILYKPHLAVAEMGAIM
ncbi:hypothetical protein BS17DRAFT_883381, partial [Gyrodon lividus]